MNKSIDLNDDQEKVLQMALEFYIRLGLGQFSQIGQRINLMYGKRLGLERMKKVQDICEELEKLVCTDGSWFLTDEETSVCTLNAALIEAQLEGNKRDVSKLRKLIRVKREKI